MLRATLKSLLSRKFRLLLSGLAVVLGTTFVASAFVVTDTIGRSFNQLISDAYSTVDVVVTGPEQATSQFGETEPIPAPVLDQIRALPEAAEAVPLVWAEGATAIDNRTDRAVSTFSGRLGSNWYGEDELLQLREGRGPTAEDEVAINAELARAGGFDVGDPIRVETPREPLQPFTVVGIFGYAGDRDSLFGETQVAFTTPVAQELMLGQGDVYTEIDVQAAGDVSPPQLRDAIAAEIGGDYVVRTGEQAADEEASALQEGLSFFTYILSGFAGVALFVGIFLILNTFSIIISQRLRELALLRAVGASRRQMIGSVMLEATVIGVVASAIGLVLGIGVGAGLAALATNLFGGLPLAGIAVPPIAIILTFALGLIVTLLAAVLPALRASRVPPMAAIQEAAIPDRPLTRLTVAGAVTTLAGVVALTISLTGNAGGATGTLWLLLGGVLLAFVGVALLTPLLARPVVLVIGRIFAWSTPGELGRRNTGRNPRRTAITAAALMIGVALVTAISTIFTSLTTSIDRTIDTSLQAELIIAGQQTSALPPAFDPAVLEQARQLPEVAAVAGIWFDFAEVEGGDGFVTAVDDPAALRDMTQTEVVDGSVGQLASGELLVDEELAEQEDLAVGDRVPITLTTGGERQYTVVGIFEGGQVMSGYLISAEDASAFRSPKPVQGLVELREGADAEAVRLELEQLLADSPSVLVQDQSGFVEQQTQIFDQILIFVQLLLVLAMVIAVLGVVNTLVLSVIERTRELGLLRAVGLSRGATARMVTVESMVISLFGALLGIGVGAALGAAVVRALRDEGFTHISLPWGLMATYLVLGAIVGVVAAVIPAIRAARLNVLNAIAYE